MLATVDAADSASTVREKGSIFIYSEEEPHAMYSTYKQTRTLCVLQYLFAGSDPNIHSASGGPQESLALPIKLSRNYDDHMLWLQQLKQANQQLMPAAKYQQLM